MDRGVQPSVLVTTPVKGFPMHPRVPLFAIFLGVLAAGCAAMQQPTSPGAGLREPMNTPDQPDLGHYASRTRTYDTYHVFVSTTVQSCSGLYPTFEFDSAKLDAEEQAGLRELAACMKTGPLRGKRVLVTGRTDPRGTVAHNDKLGLERAARVKRYLLAHGIASDRVLTASVGETDASPLPRDWPQDRHVQVSEAP